jgi:hypothetical protein
MTSPTISDVHVNAPLTNISVAFLQNPNNFIAAKVFPIVGVDKRSDVYYQFDRGYFNRNQAQKRAPNTASAGADYALTTDSYLADVWAVHKDIADQIRANTDAVLNPDVEATEFVAHQLLIQREKAFADGFMTTSVWGKDVTGVVSNPSSGTQTVQWDNGSSDPVRDIRTAKREVQEKTGFRPNTLTLGRSVFDALLDNDAIVDRIKYGQTPGAPAIVNEQALAALFEVDRVLVSDAIVNTAAEGQTNDHDLIIGKSALLTYSPGTPGIMTPSAGYTFAWTGLMGATAESEGMRIRKFRRPEEFAADRVEGEMAYTFKKVSADLGYFFNTIVS